MSQNDLATLIAALIVTHGAAIGAAIWATAKFAVARLIDWVHIQRDIEEIKKDIEELKGDVNAAHAKIRAKE